VTVVAEVLRFFDRFGRDNSGFTMIEMIAALVIFAFMITTVAFFMSTGYKNYMRTYGSENTLQKERNVLTGMEREIWDAQSSTISTLSGSPVDAVVTTDNPPLGTLGYGNPDNELDIYVDVNHQGFPDEVVYYVDNNSVLWRGVFTPLAGIDSYPYTYPNWKQSEPPTNPYKIPTNGRANNHWTPLLYNCASKPFIVYIPSATLDPGYTATNDRWSVYINLSANVGQTNAGTFTTNQPYVSTPSTFIVRSLEDAPPGTCLVTSEEAQ
jgi:prepilin-type N-terminal cleavage/methylation domain-containing protein